MDSTAQIGKQLMRSLSRVAGKYLKGTKDTWKIVQSPRPKRWEKEDDCAEMQNYKTNINIVTVMETQS